MTDAGEPAIDWDSLRARAREIAAMARAPYSGLHVGAAGITEGGDVRVGCNVENASYGLTLCAECGLVSDLARHGDGRLVAVAVCDHEGAKLTPCGRCRQLLMEAGGPTLLVDHDPEPLTIADLLPDAFGGADLPDRPDA